MIRPLCVEDIPSVMDLIKSSGPFVSPRGASDYWLYASLFTNTCLCSVDGDHISGIIISFLDQSKKRTELYVQDLAVAQDARKAGIGYELMTKIFNLSQQMDVNRIWLTCEAENKAALALWRRLGMQNNKADYLQNGFWTSKDLKGKGKDRIIFEKLLSQP